MLPKNFSVTFRKDRPVFIADFSCYVIFRLCGFLMRGFLGQSGLGRTSRFFRRCCTFSQFPPASIRHHDPLLHPNRFGFPFVLYRSQLAVGVVSQDPIPFWTFCQGPHRHWRIFSFNNSLYRLGFVLLLDVNQRARN